MHDYDAPYSLISRFIENRQTKEDDFVFLTLFALGYFPEVFVFKRVRLHLAELANWNNRPEVSRNAKSLKFLSDVFVAVVYVQVS